MESNMHEMFMKYGYPNFKPLDLMAGILFLLAAGILALIYLTNSKEINQAVIGLFKRKN